MDHGAVFVATCIAAAISGTEGPSRFTVNTDFTNCAYKETLTLCQASTVLTAADGFDSYKWEKTAGANQDKEEPIVLLPFQKLVLIK